MPLEHIRANEPFRMSAGGWNRLVDAAKKVEQQQAAIDQLARRGNASPNKLLVSNDTGIELERFSVVRLDGLKIDLGADMASIPLDAHVYSGKKVDDSSHWTNLAIIQSPAKVGSVVEAVIDGTSYGLFDDDINLLKGFVWPDETKFKAGRGPFRVLAARGELLIVQFDYGSAVVSLGYPQATVLPDETGIFYPVRDIAANATHTCPISARNMDDLPLETGSLSLLLRVTDTQVAAMPYYSGNA